MNLDNILIEIKKLPQNLPSLLSTCVLNASKIVILGNGGSNSIASHIAVDYRKFLNKRVEVLTDPSMLTMLANDYGQEHSYAKFIEMSYEENMLVILVSSSGNSINIVNALYKCKELGCHVISLSGFHKNNKLKLLSDELGTKTVLLNYHVDSTSYGVVENVHQIILHSIIDN